jgi:hypothetical protein
MNPPLPFAAPLPVEPVQRSAQQGAYVLLFVEPERPLNGHPFSRR